MSIGKTNLPNVKLQVDSFSLTRGTMDITGQFNPSIWWTDANFAGAFWQKSKEDQTLQPGASRSGCLAGFTASKAWTGSTSAASPYTTALGSGTALSIQPAYITLKFWKRTS